MYLAHGPQRSDACEARTRGPSVSSQALYHWATALLVVSVKFYPDYIIDISYTPMKAITVTVWKI